MKVKCLVNGEEPFLIYGKEYAVIEYIHHSGRVSVFDHEAQTQSWLHSDEYEIINDES